jgi:hypothetical protein
MAFEAKQDETHPLTIRNDPSQKHIGVGHDGFEVASFPIIVRNEIGTEFPKMDLRHFQKLGPLRLTYGNHGNRGSYGHAPPLEAFHCYSVSLNQLLLVLRIIFNAGRGAHQHPGWS